MLKKMLFALVPMMMLASVTFASDDVLDGLSVDSIQDAAIAIEESSLDLDVDALAENAGAEADDQAIEACFRSFGYRSHGGYGYGGYNCYRPSYGYGYGYGCHNYSSYYCYRPVTYYTPCYPVYTHYWGCY